MEEIIYILLGIAMVYVLTHFYVTQFTKSWSERSTYERFLTIMGGFVIVLVTFT